MYKEKPSVLFQKYAVPQMVGLLLNSVYLIVDGIFIGNRLGRGAMAAAAVSVPAIEILIALALAVSSGAGIIISRHLGRKERKEANGIFNLSVIVLGAMGILIVVLGNIFIHPLAVLLGATPDIHGEAVTYLWYILTFSPFLLFSFLLSGLVRNDNRPKLAMIALTVGSLSNILLDYVFMYPMNMGIGGAALATALGPIFSVLILLPHFLRKKGFLFFAKCKGTLKSIQRIFTLGFPAFIMEFSIGIVTFIYNFFIIRYGYGEIGLASYLMIGYIALIILTIFLGAAQGLQPIFSYYDGAGEFSQSRALLSFSKKMVLFIGIFCYVLVVVFSKGFFSLFSPGDWELAAFTHKIAVVYFCGFLFAGYNILMISYWQSVNRTKSALLISLMRSVIVLPLLMLVLPVFRGNSLIWICHSVSEAVSAAAALLLYLHVPKIQRIKLSEKVEQEILLK
jgi:putative MATE family efflux protein